MDILNKTTKTSAKTVGGQAEIWNGYVPKTCLENCLYTAN